MTLPGAHFDQNAANRAEPDASYPAIALVRNPLARFESKAIWNCGPVMPWLATNGAGAFWCQMAVRRVLDPWR